MKRDSRLSDALHVLLHMARHEGPLTSEQLSQAMRTNPVVVRRLMAGLREKGLVASAKGHGGGWTLSCDLAEVTLRDIHEALGEPNLFAIGNRQDNPQCLVERAVNNALQGTLEEAGTLILERFEEVSLARLSADFEAGFISLARHPHPN